MTHAERAEGSDIARNFGIVAGEELALAIVGRVAASFFVPGGPVAELDARRIAARAPGLVMQSGNGIRIALSRVQWKLRIRADRIPGVAERDSAAQCRRALAADPERRVRLLHRLRQKHDIRELHVLTMELRIVLRPQRLERSQILVGHLAALSERRRADRFELLIHPAYAA